MTVRETIWERRRDLASLFLVVFLAAALRLGRGDVVEYFHDDAMLATLALELADGRSFPLTGILSSTGIPNPPVSVYALAFPFALSSSPAFVIHVIMFWNVFGVALLWFLARRYCGQRIALVAGLVYAVNPWAILFSRKIWAQELHTPIILFGLLLLLYGFYDSRADRPRPSLFLSQCLSMPILLLGVQFHFAAWPLLVLMPAVVWQGRHRILFRAFIMGMALSLIVILPYAVGLAQTLAIDPTRISDALARSGARGPAFSLASISAMLQLASGVGMEYWLAPDQAAALAAGYPPLHMLSLVLIPALLLGIVAAYRLSRAFCCLVTTWAFLPCLLLMIEWTPVYVHYFIPSIPALALLIGSGANSILRLVARSDLRRFAVWLAIAVILALQIQQWHAALNYVENQHVPYPGFTTPLAKLSPLRDRLSGVDDVVIVAGGMSWNRHHEVAVWDTLLWDAVTCVRTIVPDGYAVFPRRPFAAVIAPDAPSGSVTSIYRNDSVEVFPTRRGGKAYLVYQWQAAPAWSGAPLRAIEPERFSNGVSLSGFALEDGLVILEWRLPARQVGADFQFSAQLFDTTGERVGQLDARFWHGRHWCEGDRLLTWGPLEAGSNARTLKVALYLLGAGKHASQISNLELVDEQGNPKGHSVDFALNQRDS